MRNDMAWHASSHSLFFVCSESFSNNQAVVLENFAEKQACSHSALILLSAGRPSPRAAWRTQTEIGHASFKRHMPHKPPLSSAPSSSSSKLPALLFLKLFIPRGLMPCEAFSPCESLCQAADASCTNSAGHHLLWKTALACLYETLRETCCIQWCASLCLAPRLASVCGWVSCGWDACFSRIGQRPCRS